MHHREVLHRKLIAIAIRRLPHYPRGMPTGRDKVPLKCYFSAKFNEVPFCVLDGPMNLVFYLETSYNSKEYQLVFYKHLILSVIKKFAYMIKAYPAENSIIIKTYAKPYNMEITFDQIWSLPSQYFRRVFKMTLSDLLT